MPDANGGGTSCCAEDSNKPGTVILTVPGYLRSRLFLDKGTLMGYIK